MSGKTRPDTTLLNKIETTKKTLLGTIKIAYKNHNNGIFVALEAEFNKSKQFRELLRRGDFNE